MNGPLPDWIATGPRQAGAPLLITAELPPDVLAWADALRREHYPPERNRLRAHVTLFHALPPSVEAELLEVLASLARQPAPAARIDGLMKLGGAPRWRSRARPWSSCTIASPNGCMAC